MFESVGREKEPDRRRRFAALLLSLFVNGSAVAVLLWAGSAAVSESAKAENLPERYVELALPAPAGSPPAAAPAAPRPRARHAEAPPVAPPQPTPDVTPPVDPPADDPVADATPAPDAAGGPGGGGGPGTGPGTGNGPGGPGEGPGVSGPKIVHWSEVVPRSRVKPRFPEAARVAGLREGACLVRIHLDARGVPTAVEPRECPAVFLDATVSAAMQWRFEPVVQDGISVPAMFDLKVNYKSE